MSALEIRLFGQLRIRLDGQPITTVNTNRLRSLLAYLLLHGDAPQSREYLAFLLWPESEEAQARTNLRQLLHHLRRAIPGDPMILSDGATIQWRTVSGCRVDVLEFAKRLEHARDAQRRKDAAEERAALEEAVSLYEDDLLPGLYDAWLRSRREQLRQLCNEALSRLSALLEQASDYAGAIRYGERLLAQDPLQEAPYQRLIRLHTLNQDRAAAIRTYNQCQKALRRELGLSPGPATRQLFEKLVKSEAPLAAIPEARAGAPVSAMRLVGRGGELARLLDTWELAKHGRAMFALVEGEAGIGKSRLAEELFLRVTRAGGAAARTRCYPAPGHLSYAPLTDLLRTEPLRAAVMDLAKPQLTEVSRVLPELLAERPDISAPRPLTESWQRRHFFEALAAVIGKAAKPLLLVIDDLHWCDRETLEWLHHYLCHEPGMRLMVLGTARPEEVNREHALWSMSRELMQVGQGVELAIGPLDAETTRALAGEVAQKPLDEGYLWRLHADTKGNALFVVESVRAHLENPECQTVSASPLVHSVITSRLANLSPSAYSLAGLAAVLGRSFRFDLLSAASDSDESTLASALEELWLKRILDGRGAKGYDFTHDVLREVTYSELTPVRRRFLHLRAARALEGVQSEDPETLSGQIAEHYERAGMPEQAIPHYHRAAQVAQRMYADADAAESLSKALALCREVPASRNRDRMELDLLASLEPAQFTTLGYAAPEVGETNARAFVLVKKLGDRRHLLNVLGGGWLFHIVRGKLAMARDRSQQFLEAAADEGESMQAAGHFMHGAVLFHLGELAAAREHMERAVATHVENGEPPLAMFFGPNVGVFARCYLAHILGYSGFPDQGMRLSEEAVALAREPAHPFSLAIASFYAAVLRLIEGDFEASARYAEEAVAVSGAHGFPYYLGCARILDAAAKAMLGTDVEHLNDLREAVAEFKASGAELRLPLYHGLVAEICLKHGLAGEGLAHVAAAFSYEKQNQETWWNPELRRLQGDLVAQEQPDNEGVLTCYRGALASAGRTGARTAELRIATRLARLLIHRGRNAEARAILEPIRSWWTEGFGGRNYRESSKVLRQTERFAGAGSA